MGHGLDEVEELTVDAVLQAMAYRRREMEELATVTATALGTGSRR